MFDAILHDRWAPGAEDTIIGFWAEDGSKYTISCPPALRDEIINMQNALYKRKAQIEELEAQLSTVKLYWDKVFS